MWWLLLYLTFTSTLLNKEYLRRWAVHCMSPRPSMFLLKPNRWYALLMPQTSPTAGTVRLKWDGWTRVKLFTLCVAPVSNNNNDNNTSNQDFFLNAYNDDVNNINCNNNNVSNIAIKIMLIMMMILQKINMILIIITIICPVYTRWESVTSSVKLHQNNLFCILLLKWLGNIVEGCWKLRNLCLKCYFWHFYTVLTL